MSRTFVSRWKNPSFPKLALFSHLKNLHSLRLRETSVNSQDETWYSIDALEAMDSLINLDFLQILSSKTVLCRPHMPRKICKLDLPISSQVFLGQRSLEQLTLRIDLDSDVTSCSYPWDTLAALEIVVTPQVSKTPELFLRKLLIQPAGVDAFELLRRLKITLTKDCDANADVCETIFACFSGAPITELELDYGSYEELPTAVQVPWTLINKLTLRVTTNLAESYQLYDMLDLLRDMPDLRELALIDFDWTGARGPSPINIDEPNLVTSYATYPVLFTLIHLIREATDVLRICVCRSDGNGVRWHRSSRVEDFQADRYVLKR